MVRLADTVGRLDLDNRDLPIIRGHDETEDLARMLIAAEGPGAFTRAAAAAPGPGQVADASGGCRGRTGLNELRYDPRHSPQVMIACLSDLPHASEGRG
ncbi:hypothetical protein OHB06_00935 [Streptomyces sp. NBC_01604]|uniref:hypothetical protein n=1 Tax=Streptomyces sp. NBC_01604 TaxID=2975894 RepID=UPI00386BA467